MLPSLAWVCPVYPRPLRLSLGLDCALWWPFLKHLRLTFGLTRGRKQFSFGSNLPQILPLLTDVPLRSFRLHWIVSALPGPALVCAGRPQLAMPWWLACTLPPSSVFQYSYLSWQSFSHFWHSCSSVSHCFEILTKTLYRDYRCHFDNFVQIDRSHLDRNWRFWHAAFS